jgi:hypothetical protein
LVGIGGFFFSFFLGLGNSKYSMSTATPTWGVQPLRSLGLNFLDDRHDMRVGVYRIGHVFFHPRSVKENQTFHLETDGPPENVTNRTTWEVFIGCDR